MGNGALYRDFIHPPFSVLDARSGWWRGRKKSWLELGIASERGRKINLLGGLDDALRLKNRLDGKSNKPISHWVNISIFDPVLTELCYAWFCPDGGRVLDPFAGGSVRGIVASLMGRRYVGVDLRQEQIQENQRQAAAICSQPFPEWRCGNSINLYNVWRGSADFVLTCPPYGDLERYSDDPADLSNMPYDMFVGCFRAAMKQAANRLKEDRFTVVVVGDFRDKHGTCRGFVKDAIAACQDAGLNLYNDAVLITAAGSLPMRARGAFEASRKLGKSHQNILVFVKGDPAKARKELGTVEPCDLRNR